METLYVEMSICKTASVVYIFIGFEPENAGENWSSILLINAKQFEDLSFTETDSQ